MAEKDLKTEFRNLAEKLHDPMRLRILACGAAVAIAFFVIDGTLDGKIRQSSRQLQEAKRLQTLHESVELLRATAKQIQPHVAANRDANESVQFVLDGIRALPVQMLHFDSKPAVTVGPYEAVVLEVKVCGELQHLDELLAWLETNERLFRIDAMKLEPPSGQLSTPALHLTVLGLKVR